MGRRLASLVKGLQIQHNGSSWKLTNRLGAGGFAEVWEVVTESRKKHAVKFDLEAGNASVFHEHRILAKLKPYDRIVHVLKDGDGWFEGHFYFAMDLQGRNVAELQRACLAGRFDLATCKSFGVSMLEALEQVHSAGYVHRDVKPANFVQGRTTGSAGSLYILDFGVARRFRDENSRVKPQRMGYDEFRGSTTYASINALHKQDQGRRDDVWSWLYMLAEMLNGHLPWKDAGKAATNGRAAGSPEEQKQAEKQTVLEAKLACLADPSLLFTITPLPEPIGQMSRYLETMEFEAEPDYQLLRQLLGSLSQFPCDAAAASAAAFQAQADFDSEGSFPASPASPPDDARGFMPQPRPMMAPTSYIPGMQDPAFPQAASPASSHGDEDDVGDAPALLAGDDDMGMGPGATPPRRLNSPSALPKKSPKLLAGRSKVGGKGWPRGPTHSAAGGPAAAPATAPAAESTPTPPPTQAACPSSAASGADGTLQQPLVPGLQTSAAGSPSSQPPFRETAQPAAAAAHALALQPSSVQPTLALPPRTAAIAPAAAAAAPAANGHEALWPPSGGTHSSQWEAPGTAAAAGLPGWMDASSTLTPSPPGNLKGTLNPAVVGTHSEALGSAAVGAADAAYLPSAAAEAPESLQHDPPSAELAGANTADGYGHGMFTAPELDYGISGDDSAAATPAQIGALEPASDETADHQLPDGPPSAQSGYPFPDSGHTLQQEGQLVGESPTADIVPRLGTPPVLSGVPTAASSRPAVDLPPPPPRLGGMIQQDGFRPDRAPYFVVPPTGPIKLPIPARPGVTPRGQPQQNGGPFTRSRSDPNEEAAAREPGPASAERQLPPQLPGRLPEEAAAGKKRQADSAAAAEAPFKLQRTGSGSPVASPRLPSNHVANVAPTNGSGRSWGLEGGSRQQAQQFAVPEARPANGDTKAGWHAADGHRHLQGGLHPDATGSHAQGNPGDTHARDRSRERSRSRGLWPDDRDKLPAPRAHSHDRDRSQRPEAHSNSRYCSSKDDYHASDERRDSNRHGRCELSSRDEGLTGRRDESARNRYAPRNDHRPSGRDGGRDESPRQPQQIRAPLHERRDRSESIQPRSVGRQANMRDGRAGERMLPYEVWARSLKQHTEALQDSDPYKELQDQARKFEKGGPGVPGFAAELKGDLNRLDAVELQSVVAWIVEYKLHSRSQAHDLNRVSNLIEDVSHFAHQTSKRAHQRYKDQR
ncbi:hypothetical protein WJX74_008685 [Apatococcus lobatus]|uniref:Protein kinase domain-containing protein n=1 Tax=Apatococcus lobatus TaxID=904363 RepID=A0AAW1SAW0_9CHLO